jgi:SNF2 family DNA or RNA helicase
MTETSKEWVIEGRLVRPDATLALDKIGLLFTCGLMVTGEHICRIDPATPWEWLLALRKLGSIRAPEDERDELLSAVFESTSAPAIQMPENAGIAEMPAKLVPAVRISQGSERRPGEPRLAVELSFHYDNVQLKYGDPRRAIFDNTSHRVLRRDMASEQQAFHDLSQVAYVGNEYDRQGPHWNVSEKNLPALVARLGSLGWRLDFEGKSFRAPGQGSLSISSGIDWFDLDGEVDYGGTVARLPALLEALQRNDKLVHLADGSFGVLPEEWLKRLSTIANIGEMKDGVVRFTRSQTGLLDALLATQPGISFDEGFAQAREQLQRFKGIAPADQPATFTGQLREYQREGLGWMRFLDDFGFGGCLADDMGVGKTVQVLALLEARRTAPDRSAPSLVVVPRSLIFNWMQEAQRFAPELRVLDHTGGARSIERFPDHDLVLTTYGTMRRDIAKLKDYEFDYLILDEAQAIKNVGTDTAKAVRLLRGRRRLAMSGTPVENHLGELWSLFEFLNPGMLGGAKVLRAAGSELRNPGEGTRTLLAHALRPYILRRTKSQVAKELPEKTEQTVFCELDKEQRRLYDEMREFYRASLLQRVDDEGLAKSKMHVLEALLRLRQAACHPGLLDAKRKKESSAKLDSLLGHLESVMEEGHKALVFSQFTSLLAIVKDRLDQASIPYEYLDGKTRDRESCVERFQKDEKCRLFLVSLKAGGLGLNLTAAEYVFLLDPWWNPAVESQAIDRAHRIGQTNQVFAYRLIARDTVEEKVLELQKSKRDLADAIISADNSLIRTLQREDLELLLS